MRNAAGFAVIWGVIFAAVASFGVSGLIGATAVNLVESVGHRGSARPHHWAWFAMFLGVGTGWATAIVTLAGAALLDLSIENVPLGPVCWVVAAIAGAVGDLVMWRRVQPASEAV